MAIKKVIDGKLKTIVEDGVTDHNKLEGRDEYGCHPISAIRKLPEKLFELKNSIATLAEEINEKITAAENVTRNVLANTEHLDLELDSTNETIQNLLNSINNVKLNVDGSTVTFTDSNNQSQTFRVGSDVDNDTIKTDGEGRIALKKIYTNEEFIGDGTKSNSLQLKTKPDNSSIVINNNKYEARAIKDSNGNSFTYQDIANQNSANQNTFNSIQAQFQSTAQSVNGNFTQVNNSITQLQGVDNLQAQKINDLEARTKGLGGYLNAYNFGANPSQEALTNYAIQDTNVLNANQIFNGTKVKNLYDDHIWALTNTPESDPAVFSWQDLGTDPAVSDANNDGIHGLITGSYEHLEGFIDLLGHLTINGLQEELDLIKGNISDLVSDLQTLSTSVISNIQNVSNTLSASINALTSRVSTIETTLANHTHTVSDITDFPMSYDNNTDTWTI